MASDRPELVNLQLRILPADRDAFAQAARAAGKLRGPTGNPNVTAWALATLRAAAAAQLQAQKGEQP